MTDHPTPNQYKALGIIAREIERQGIPPTLREFCKQSGLSSTSSAARYYRLLAERDWIKIRTDKAGHYSARTARLTAEGKRTFRTHRAEADAPWINSNSPYPKDWTENSDAAKSPRSRSSSSS